LHRFALVRRGGYEYKLFSLTYSLIAYSASRRPLPLDVRPLAPARVRLCPPAFVGFGFWRLHPVLIHSASSSLTKSTTPTDCFTDFYNFLRLISSIITPSTRQNALWLSPHRILTFFFLTKYATSCQLAVLTTKTTT
jgi:hypothetical protein